MRVHFCSYWRIMLYSIGILQNVWKYFRQVSRHSLAFSNCTLSKESVICYSVS